MFMQERFVDTAVKRAIVYLKEDPFCSEIIDGDIMKLVSEVDIELVKDFKEELLGIIAKEDDAQVDIPHLVATDALTGDRIPGADLGRFETPDGVHAAQIEMFENRELVVLVLKGLASRALDVEHR